MRDNTAFAVSDAARPPRPAKDSSVGPSVRDDLGTAPAAARLPFHGDHARPVERAALRYPGP